MRTILDDLMEILENKEQREELQMRLLDLLAEVVARRVVAGTVPLGLSAKAVGDRAERRSPGVQRNPRAQVIEMSK